MAIKWLGWGGSFLLLFILGQSTPLDPDHLTLKGALNLGWSYASDWDPRAVLISATSVDDEEKDGVKGQDGRRRFWNLIYAVPEEKRSLILSIRNQKVQQIETGDLYQAEEGIEQSEIQVGSPWLVRKARTAYHLGPGTNWAEGYHFIVFKSGKTPFITVVGLNPKGKLTKIYFDPRDGRYLGMVTTGD